MADKSPNWQNRQAQNIEQMMSDASSMGNRIKSTTEQVTKAVDDQANRGIGKIGTRIKRAVTDLAQNLMATFGRTSKRIDSQFYNATEGITKNAKKAQKAIKELDIKEGKDSFLKRFNDHASHLKEHLPVLREGIEVITKFTGVAAGMGAMIASINIPLAAFIALTAAIAIAVVKVAEKIVGLTKDTEDLWQAMGGMDKLQNFMNMIDGLQRSTTLSSDKIIELGRAFYAAGNDMSAGNMQLQSYLDAAGKAQKIWGTSGDTLAKFARTMSDAGKTGGEFYDQLNALHGMVQDGKLTFNDLNDAISEAEETWKNFGGTGSMSLGILTEEIGNLKAHFKSMNLDVKETGAYMNQMFGTDIKSRRRLAAMTSRRSGGNYFADFNMQTEDSTGYHRKMSGDYLREIAAQFGDKGFLAGDDLDHKYNAEERFKIHNQLPMMQSHLERMGYKNMGSTLSSFQNFASGRIAKGEDIEKLITEFTQKTTQYNPNHTGLNGAIDAHKATPAGMMETVGNTLDSIATKFATLLIPAVLGILKGVEMLTHMDLFKMGNDMLNGLPGGSRDGGGGTGTNRGANPGGSIPLAPGGAVNGAPKSNHAIMQDTMQYLISRGVSPNAAAGIVGNMMVESTGRTGAIGDGGTSGGLFQWHNGRKAALNKYAAAHHMPWTDRKTQLDFMLQESNARGDLGAVNNASSPAEAAMIWQNRFERPDPKYAHSDLRRRRAIEAAGMTTAVPAVTGQVLPMLQPMMGEPISPKMSMTSGGALGAYMEGGVNSNMSKDALGEIFAGQLGLDYKGSGHKDVLKKLDEIADHLNETKTNAKKHQDTIQREMRVSNPNSQAQTTAIKRHSA